MDRLRNQSLPYRPFQERVPQKVALLPTGHGGNVHAAVRDYRRPINRWIDFSASINPLGLSKAVRRALTDAIPLAIHYPDPDGWVLRRRIGEVHKLDPQNVILGNGSSEIISFLPRVLSTKHGLVIGPTFAEYERALTLAGAQCTYIHATADQIFEPPIEYVKQLLVEGKGGHADFPSQRGQCLPPVDTVFLCNPNNPTGRVLSHQVVEGLAETVVRVGGRLVVDEAYIDFCASRSMIRQAAKTNGLVVVRSFTKFYAMPGVRLGYGVASQELIDKIRSFLPPWSVNSFAQAAAAAALGDKEYQTRSLTFIRQERDRFIKQLRNLPGVRLYPSATNFILMELPSRCSVSAVDQWLRGKGLLVRTCQNIAGINACMIRLAVRRPRENDRLVKTLRRALKL